MTWESGSFLSERMPPFELDNDPTSYIRVLGRVATRYSDAAEKLRDMLARGSARRSST